MKWISIKDKLPDNYIFVYVFLKNNHYSIASYNDPGINKWGDEPTWYISDSAAFKNDEIFRALRLEDMITHWMPFPEAPKDLE